MFASNTERKIVESEQENSPGPQHYANSAVHLMKKDFSRPRIVIAQPTRNLDGAIRANPDIASDELKHSNISPGPAPLLDYPGAKVQERQKTEPRMRQYGLNMITNTLQDPDQIKTNNEVAKAALKKRLETHHAPGPGEYDPVKKPPIGAL